jgi:hypothetical protein
VNSRLKLRAEDEEDLRVIAACLQDALIPLSDIHFLDADRRFVMVANRFRWENCELPDIHAIDDHDSGSPNPNADAGLDGCASYERVNCGIMFDNVTAVRRRGFDQRDRGRILELLTMKIEVADNGRMAVTMVFSGDAAIRLEGEKINCRVSDIGEPWPTQWRPSHPIDDAAA